MANQLAIKKVQLVAASRTDVADIHFDTCGYKFLVKNFTNGDIFVGIGSSSDSNCPTAEECAEIKKNCYQVICANEGCICLDSNLVVYGDVATTGTVEVQMVLY